MLTASRLEKIIELENDLRAQYQEQLDNQQAEIDRLTKQNEEMEAKQAKLQDTINTQLEQIKELSAKATANERVEQLNRELSNRSEKQVAEIAEQKKRIKTLQKDLAAVREENKTLTQYDPVRMRKNLDANKKKLAEKTKANELLQKTLKEVRHENAELKAKTAELEAKLPTDAEVEEVQADEKNAA